MILTEVLFSLEANANIISVVPFINCGCHISIIHKELFITKNDHVLLRAEADKKGLYRLVSHCVASEGVCMTIQDLPKPEALCRYV